MKKYKLLLISLIFALAGTFAFADNKVLDFANILSETEKSELEAIASSYELKYSFPFYVATVYDMVDLGYYDIEKFSEYFYAEYNLGTEEDHTGLMLILSMKDRDYDIVAHGDRGHYSFTDYGKDEIAYYFKPAFRENNWFEGFKAYFEAAAKILEYADSGEPVDVYSENYESPTDFQGVTLKELLVAETIFFAIAMIIALIVAAVQAAKLNNVSLATDADAYIRSEDVKVTSRDSKFLRQTKHVERIESKSSSGGGGGTTVSSGGYSHSSGKF